MRITPLGADSSKKLEGSSADVEPAYLGMDDGRAKDYCDSTEPPCVAVKKLRLDYDTVDGRVLAVSVVPSSESAFVPDILIPKFQALAHEVSLLSKLSHPNIVKLVGFVEDVKEGAAWMILPWESNGNLREYVQSTDLEIPERVSLVCLTVGGVQEVSHSSSIQIFDVAQGIQYLHSRKPSICHGDLKSVSVIDIS